ncbi:MAG TPA: cation transporting ATPase C-terminal domain-containing protein [Longimicrobiales bacterium]|nr:cation transporting ATPase C-terminal domain-containing protein [Longimicrobiales bacterium]
MALAFEPGEPGLIDRPPRPTAEGVLSRPLLRRLATVGILLAAGTLGTFLWSLQRGYDLDTARTMAMTQMVVFQFFHVFNCRALDTSVFRVPFFSNRFLFLALLAAAGAHMLVVYLPAMQRLFRTTALGPGDWLVLTAVATLVIMGGEADKWWHARAGVRLA